MPRKREKKKHSKNKSNQKRNFLEKNYKKSWRYLKDSRVFIYAAVFFFLFFILIGFFVPAPGIIETKILEFLEEMLQRTGGMSHWELVGFIFLNNAQSAFFGMVFGILFGIFSLMTAIVNGYLLGFVAERVIEADGVSTLWRLFPHGIFELPALFVSVGLGLKLGSFILREKKLESLKNYLINSLRVFIFIVIPLLILAAIIEGSLIFLFSN